MINKLDLLTEVLGLPVPACHDNHQFRCPFCNHHNPKLSIHLTTERWMCWVCLKKGRGLYKLFKLLNVAPEKLQLLPYTGGAKAIDHDHESVQVELPSDYQPLYVPNPKSFFWRKAVEYLTTVRGLSLSDLVTYNIGYCEEGTYEGYIIFPNYDEHGRLTYFTTRTYLPNKPSFKNPPAPRSGIVGFDLQVDWHQPIILVESAINAITLRDNASPLYGKVLTPAVKAKGLEAETPEIDVILDGDALMASLEAIQYFLGLGVAVNWVQLPYDQDPNSLGREAMHKLRLSKRSITSEILFELQIKNSIK